MNENNTSFNGNTYTIKGQTTAGDTTSEQNMANRPDMFDMRFAGLGPEIMRKTGFSSSTEVTQLPGLTVKTGSGMSKGVVDIVELDDTDLIDIGGLEVTVAQARNLGLDVDSAVERGKKKPLVVDSSTADAKPDATKDRVDVTAQALENGSLTQSEAVPVSVAYESIALNSSLKADAAAELVKDVYTGELNERDPVWQEKQLGNVSYEEAKAHGKMIHRSMQQSAQKELSAREYNQLVDLAASSPAIKQKIIQYGFAKASGKGGSWKQLHQQLTK